MKTYLYLLLPFFLFSSACKEDNLAQLPPATQEGKGILGCLVNGEVFVAQGGRLGGTDDLSISVSKTDVSLGSEAVGNDTDIEGSLVIYFHIENIYTTNKVSLINETDKVGRYRSSKGQVFLTGQDKYVGEFTITKLDTVNYIIAGTFWFDAVSEVGEVVEIREGRFDIDYNCCTQYPDLN
jgi:hypothetical protein